MFRSCDGFRMTAHRDGAACTGAVVRKPPRNEPAGEVRGRRSALSYGDYISAGTVKPLFTFTHSFVRPEEPILSSRPDFCRARRARSVKDGTPRLTANCPRMLPSIGVEPKEQPV